MTDEKITDHHINPANKDISIVRHREGSVYVLGASTGKLTRLFFQNGPIKEVGVNGITNEALLAVVADRLRHFQRGEYACKENALAFLRVQEALAALHSRTARREKAGVEGTLKVAPGEGREALRTDGIDEINAELAKADPAPAPIDTSTLPADTRAVLEAEVARLKSLEPDPAKREEIKVYGLGAAPADMDRAVEADLGPAEVAAPASATFDELPPGKIEKGKKWPGQLAGTSKKTKE